MELQWSSFLDFELVFFSEDLDEGLWIFDSKGQIIHINSNILIVVSILAHPDVRFCLAWYISFFLEDITEFVMPPCSTRS